LSKRWRRSELSAENTVSSPETQLASVSVAPVRSRNELREFIRLPWRLYARNPCWVPPLLRLQDETFSPEKNAFFQHADVQLFLAYQGSRAVGRISAQIDHEHNRYHDEKTGFFGFFEAEDDPSVATALLKAAEQWLRQRGMDRVRGPLNFSTNGEVGFLVDGFDSPPVILMPYTHDYYLPLVEGAGYARVRDLYAWRWQAQPVPPGSPARMASELRSRPEVSVRRANMRRLRDEVRTILELYNDSFAQNWGFVPATEAEADAMARDLKLIVDPDIVPIIEVDGKPAGVALAVPNLNEAIRDLNGRLLPLGFIKLLWRLKVRRVRSGRLLILGIKKEFRSRKYAGLAYLLCDEIYRGATERGYDWAEFSWTLEDNNLINNLIEKVGARHYKTYRIYEKPLLP
jgi:GNAT superfamily N-acetyltransferase